MTRNDCQTQITEFINQCFFKLKADEPYLNEAKNIADHIKGKSFRDALTNENLMFISQFLIYTKSYQKFVIKGPDNFGLRRLNNGYEYILQSGMGINDIIEFNEFIGVILDNINQIAKDREIKILNIDKKQTKDSANAKIEAFISSNSEALIELFKCMVNEFEKKNNKVREYYNLLKKYFCKPTQELYCILLSKIVNVKSIEDTVNIDLKTALKAHLEYYNSDKKQNRKQVLLQVLKSSEENNEPKVRYLDDEYVELSKEATNQLNEIYFFVRCLNKEDLKEFASDPYSYFTHIDPIYRDDVAHDFIVTMNKKAEVPYRETITKRLRAKLVG